MGINARGMYVEFYDSIEHIRFNWLYVWNNRNEGGGLKHGNTSDRFTVGNCTRKVEAGRFKGWPRLDS